VLYANDFERVDLSCLNGKKDEDYFDIGPAHNVEQITWEEVKHLVGVNATLPTVLRGIESYAPCTPYHPWSPPSSMMDYDASDADVPLDNQDQARQSDADVPLDNQAQARQSDADVPLDNQAQARPSDADVPLDNQAQARPSDSSGSDASEGFAYRKRLRPRKQAVRSRGSGSSSASSEDESSGEEWGPGASTDSSSQDDEDVAAGLPLFGSGVAREMLANAMKPVGISKKQRAPRKRTKRVKKLDSLGGSMEAPRNPTFFDIPKFVPFMQHARTPQFVKCVAECFVRAYNIDVNFIRFGGDVFVNGGKVEFWNFMCILENALLQVCDTVEHQQEVSKCFVYVAQQTRLLFEDKSLSAEDRLIWYRLIQILDKDVGVACVRSYVDLVDYKARRVNGRKLAHALGLF
jgi:hypothetical protein